LIKTSDGIQWMAKFPSTKDRYAIVQMEAATMSIAKKAGMKVPETRLIECGGKKVLMVRRFDITENCGRCHMISMQTLLKADGWYNLGYSDLYSVIKKYSSRPEIDIPAFYRQMVFNAIIGNTDDHLKNFSFIHDKTGYCLSPCYDLLPDTGDRHEHVLFFEPGCYVPSKKNLAKLGKQFGVKNAEIIIIQVIQAVKQWKTEFLKFEVPEIDIECITNSITNRIKQQEV